MDASAPAVQSFLPLSVRGTNDDLSLRARATLSREKKEDSIMLYTIAIVLLVLWALGFFAFHVGSGLIHVLIVVAVVILLLQLLSGRRRLL
jgi:fatty acid desaturase